MKPNIEIIPMATMWMDPDTVILIKIIQRQILCDISYMQNLKKKKCQLIYMQKKSRLTDTESKLVIIKWERDSEGIN